MRQYYRWNDGVMRRWNDEATVQVDQEIYIIYIVVIQIVRQTRGHIITERNGMERNKTFI